MAVILPIKNYKKILEELEELEYIKLYYEAKNKNDKSLPIDDAFKLIEQEQKKIYKKIFE